MDWWFWIGLGLGALVSFPISIIANLWTDRVREYLGKRRTIRLSKKKSKEISTYLYVRALVEGDPTFKLLLDMDISLIGRLTTVYVFCLTVLLLLILSLFLPQLHDVRKPIVIFAFLLCLFTTFMAFPIWLIHSELQQTRRKVASFPEYEDDIREKWGDDAIEEFLQPQQE